MSDYTPRHGTLAYRALAHLEKLGRNAELTAGQLCAELDCEASALIPTMQLAISAGLLERFTKHGQTRPHFYRLTSLAAKVQEPRKTAGDAGAAKEPKGLAGAAHEAGRVAECEGEPASPGGSARQDAPELKALAAVLDASYPLPKRKLKASSAAAVERTAAPDEFLVGGFAPPLVPPPPAKTGPLRFGHWSSGEFAFERGGEVVDVFTPAEAAQLFAFVRRIDPKEVSRETT